MWVVILLFSLLWCVCVCIPASLPRKSTHNFFSQEFVLIFACAWPGLMFLFSRSLSSPWLSVDVDRFKYATLLWLRFAYLPCAHYTSKHAHSRATHTHTPNANHVSRALLCVVSLFFACKHNCLMPWKLRCVLEASFAVTLVESMSHSHSISARWWRH